jgi:hypothetical protein
MTPNFFQLFDLRRKKLRKPKNFIMNNQYVKPSAGMPELGQQTYP